MVKVSNFVELLRAINEVESDIVIMRSILANHTFILPKGTTLSGESQENGELPLLMFNNSDGVGLSTDNTIENLNIQVPVTNKAIYTISLAEDLGQFYFRNLFITGQFSFIMRKPAKKAQIVIENIDIIAADSRGNLEQPQKYGVNVLQGALTIYNFNSDSESLITAKLKNISLGRKNAPVIGSGIFLAGFGDTGGRLEISQLTTNNIYSTGKIAFGIADFITGAVFIVNGAHAKKIIQQGETITYGVNDMVLDAWGEVDDWEITGPVISYGPSGVGFVNFGIVKKFTMNAPLETYGLGARGYNQYDGTVEDIHFESIETFGHGSVAIQVSKKIGNLTVAGDVKTNGSIGNSLVKGVNVELPAYALSIKDGGEINSVKIAGNLETYGNHVTTYIVDHGGEIHNFEIDGHILAHGEDSHDTLIKKY